VVISAQFVSFSNVCISQGNVATCKVWWKFLYRFCCKFYPLSSSERTVKIGYDLVKLFLKLDTTISETHCTGLSNKNRTLKSTLIFHFFSNKNKTDCYMLKSNQFRVRELIFLCVSLIHRYILQDSWNNPFLSKTQCNDANCLHIVCRSYTKKNVLLKFIEPSV